MRALSDGWHELAEQLSVAVADVTRSADLSAVAGHVGLGLTAMGLPADRIQLPLSALFGFKHPLYAAVILTWTRSGGSATWLRTHEEVRRDQALAPFTHTPFAALTGDPGGLIRHRRDSDGWNTYPILMDLAAQGYQDYLAMSVPLPDGTHQYLSVATRNDGGFAEDAPEVLRSIAPMLGITLYAIYQHSAAVQIARTYLGHETGTQVLAGAIVRGRYEVIPAAIAFLDVRDFTHLSATLGPDRLLPLLNRAFDCLAEAIRPVHGEILKFIGDAALVMVRSDRPDASSPLDIASALLDGAARATEETAALGHALRLGVGLHLGDVGYGNVGSIDRLDFTVMGSAVNLASRLEGQTKALGAPMVVSDVYMQRCVEASGSLQDVEARLRAEVRPTSGVRLHGVQHEVTVWTVHPSPTAR